MNKIFQGADWLSVSKAAEVKPDEDQEITTGSINGEDTVCVCVCVCVCARTHMLSLFSHVQLFVTPWSVAHQAPLSMGFSRQEYWSGLLCAPPGDLPDPGILWLLHCKQILCS